MEPDDDYVENISTKPGKKKKRKASSGDDDDSDVPKPRKKQSTRKKEPKVVIYCICHQPDDGERPMIGCDGCQEWFHFDCLGMDKNEQLRVQAQERYYCPQCEKSGEGGKQHYDEDAGEDAGEATHAAPAAQVVSNTPQPDCCVPRPQTEGVAVLGTCATIGCGKPATLGPCPTCTEMRVKEQYWCCQSCFQANWVYHYNNNCGAGKPQTA